MIGHAWHQYWAWTGGNVGAMPLQALIGVVVSLLLAVVLRPLWRRLWAWLKRELSRPALEEAKAARRIAADLFEHNTGRPHPAAPAKPEEERRA
jgi:hypothetical protein